jgi:hypothetical protein
MISSKQFKINYLIFIIAFITLNSFADTFYVRPYDTNGYGTETGTSYTNAYNGFAGIDWTAVNNNDTLYVCGTHNDELVVGSPGTSESSRLIIRGDYTGDKGYIYGDDSIIDGTWTQSGNLFKYEYGSSEPSQVYLNNKIGNYNSTPTALGEWHYSSPYIYVYTGGSSPDKAYDTISVSARDRGIYIKDKNYVYIYKMNVARVAEEAPGTIGDYWNTTGAICIRSSTYCKVGYSTIEESAYCVRTSLNSEYADITDNTINGMVRREDASSKIAFGIITTGNYTEIRRNNINGIVDYYDTASSCGSSFGIQSNCWDIPNYYSYGNRISNNRVLNVGLTGIIIRNNSNDGGNQDVNIWIYDNYVDNAQYKSGDTDGIALGDDSTNNNTRFTGVNIFRNYVEDFANCGIHIANNWGENVNVKFNVLKKCGTIVPCMGAIRVANGAKVYNNTIYQVTRRHGIRVTTDNFSDTDPCVIKNNIIQADMYNVSGYTAYAIWVDPSTSATGGYNCIYGLSGQINTSQQTYNFTNSDGIYDDPEIEDPTGETDWNLQSSSPCISAGTWAYGDNKDYESKAIIDVYSPPVGALEYYSD